MRLWVIMLTLLLALPTVAGGYRQRVREEVYAVIARDCVEQVREEARIFAEAGQADRAAERLADTADCYDSDTDLGRGIVLIVDGIMSDWAVQNRGADREHSDPIGEARSLLRRYGY